MNSKELEEIKETIIKDIEKIKREGIDELLEYMNENKYFEVPASTKHHESYTGGLAVHSSRVCNAFVQIMRSYNQIIETKPKFDINSAKLCSYVHDLCKTKEYMMNEYKGWVRNPTFSNNHASLSIELVEKCGITLTREEDAIIRYHMGQFHTKEQSKYGEYTTDSLFKAVGEFCSVHFFQTADFLVSRWEDNFEDDFIPKI